MAILKQLVGSSSAVTISLNSLASATYVASSAVDNTTNDPLDLLVTLEVTSGTVASNKQVLLFAKGSLDGTDYQTGVESGTTTTDEPNLTLIGAVPCNTNATLQRGVFSVASAFGGVLPPFVKFVVKNETGVALAASGNALKVAEVSGEVV